MNKKLLPLFCMFFFFLKDKNYCNMMLDMAVMMGAQQGASLANEAINAIFQSVGQSVSSNQNVIQDAMSEFGTIMKDLQKKEMQSIEQVFTKAQSQATNQQTHQTGYFKEMETYVFQTISLQQPQHYYLLDHAAHIDELFALGTMYTPKGPVWKNVYSIGDWEYDHVTNSFWQMQNVPLLTTKVKGGKEEKVSKHAAYNSIFTEYFTQKSAYEIQCEVTIHQVHYPFFVGVMFNKNRWISGSTDSLTKCRLFGIYGLNQDDIDTYFSEQHSETTSAKDNSKKSNIVYPLQQILHKQVKAQEVIPEEIFKNMQHDPVVFIIKIITSPNKVQLKIWPAEEKEPTEFITVSSSNKNLYLYHDIGFMSPGAITQFKLVKPESLIFTPEAEKSFYQEVEALIAPVPTTKPQQTKDVK